MVAGLVPWACGKVEDSQTGLDLSSSPFTPSFHFLQANETFAFVGNVTHYAQVWLNISAEIRSFLEQGRLQQHLHWLQQVLWVQSGWAPAVGSSAYRGLSHTLNSTLTTVRG